MAPTAEWRIVTRPYELKRRWAAVVPYRCLQDVREVLGAWGVNPVPVALRLPFLVMRCVWRQGYWAGANHSLAPPSLRFQCLVEEYCDCAAAEQEESTPHAAQQQPMHLAPMPPTASRVGALSCCSLPPPERRRVHCCALVVPALVSGARQLRQLEALLRSILALETSDAARLSHAVLVDDGSPAPLAPLVADILPADWTHADGSDAEAAAAVSDDASPRRRSGAAVVDAQRFAAPGGTQSLVVLRLNRNSGPAAARNAGVRWLLQDRGQAEKGVPDPDPILFTDADMQLPPAWAQRMVAAYSPHPPGGIVIVSGITRAAGRATSALAKFHDFYGTLNGRLDKLHGGAIYGCTCNLGVSAATFKSHGLFFDEAFSTAAYEARTAKSFVE